MSHITHKVGDKEYCIVQVQEEVFNINILDGRLHCKTPQCTSTWSYTRLYTTLPEGDYTILFIAEQATHSEVKAVMSATDFIMIVNKIIPANFPNHTEFNHIVLIKNEKI